MRIKNIFLAGLMLAMVGIARAADVLSVQDVEVKPGESVTLAVSLDNTTANLMGWQCDIVLPEGLSLELKANGKPAATLGERFSATEHTISSNVLASGGYRFIATSMDGEAIPGTEGTLFTVTLKADASLTAGEKLTGTVKNIEFNTQDNQKLTFADVTFYVNILKDGTAAVTYHLAEGWNWMSINLDMDELRSARSFISPFEGSVMRMQSQTQELVNDGVFGIVGNLETLSPAEGYRIQLSGAVSQQWNGTAFVPADTPIMLYKGWNWIGYVPTVELSAQTALANLEATEGDRLVYFEGFAEFDGEKWEPDITMKPGMGYMYKSAKDVSFAYSTATSEPAAGRLMQQETAEQPECPWQYDAHRYPDVTTIIAQLEIETSAYAVGAFCGEECRGVGRWVNGRLFITVHGTCGEGETIAFRAFDPTTGEVLPVSETFVFQGQCLGSLGSPVQLHLAAEATGIGSHNVSSPTDSDVYTLDSRLVGHGDASFQGLPAGMYIVGGTKRIKY